VARGRLARCPPGQPGGSRWAQTTAQGMVGAGFAWSRQPASQGCDLENDFDGLVAHGRSRSIDVPVKNNAPLGRGIERRIARHNARQQPETHFSVSLRRVRRNVTDRLIGCSRSADCNWLYPANFPRSGCAFGAYAPRPRQSAATGHTPQAGASAAQRCAPGQNLNARRGRGAERAI
jgi:hypothetical protein